jgi:hypothetical protein
MTGSRRLYALAFSCVLAVTALLVVGARAWGTATVRRTEGRCDRPAAAVAAARQGPAVTGQGPASRSWRAHMLRVAGCGAWRQVHGRVHHRSP